MNKFLLGVVTAAVAIFCVLYLSRIQAPIQPTPPAPVVPQFDPGAAVRDVSDAMFATATAVAEQVENMRATRTAEVAIPPTMTPALVSPELVPPSASVTPNLDAAAATITKLQGALTDAQVAYARCLFDNPLHQSRCDDGKALVEQLTEQLRDFGIAASQAQNQ